jgi:alcohol dehydrogenase class IV
VPNFLSPKILYGKGMLKRLSSEIGGLGSKAVLITDKVMAGQCNDLVIALQDAGYDVSVWDRAEPEPSVATAIAGSQALLDVAPQLIVGFGGGSAIDVAKSSWMFYERPDLASLEMVETLSPRTKLGLRKKARLLAVPTTSGTGSEVTWAAVLSDESSHRKIGFGNADLVPDWALLVPEFTVGMSKALTASSGLDVLGHALDGITARQQNNFSDGLCMQALKIAFEHLPTAYREPEGLPARDMMQQAAAIAGLGFGNSNTSLSHVLGHAIGAKFGVPHGRAIGLALPYSLDYLVINPPLPGVPDPVAKLAIAARFIGIDVTSGIEAANALIAKVRTLQAELREPLSLGDLEIGDDQLTDALDDLVALAAKDVNFHSSPCEAKEVNLKSLFRSMGNREGGLKISS